MNTCLLTDPFIDDEGDGYATSIILGRQSLQRQRKRLGTVRASSLAKQMHSQIS